MILIREVTVSYTLSLSLRFNVSTHTKSIPL